jgi:hypothetical protein
MYCESLSFFLRVREVLFDCEAGVGLLSWAALSSSALGLFVTCLVDVDTFGVLVPWFKVPSQWPGKLLS